MSFNNTNLSVLKYGRLEDGCLKNSHIPEKPEISDIIDHGEHEFFNELVREYCGKNLSDISKDSYKPETSAIWEDENMNPPEIFRIIIELLHLAASNDDHP